MLCIYVIMHLFNSDQKFSRATKYRLPFVCLGESYFFAAMGRTFTST
jgi:hypothetical protein